MENDAFVLMRFGYMPLSFFPTHIDGDHDELLMHDNVHKSHLLGVYVCFLS